MLRTGATAFSYEREVPPLPRIGPWWDALDGLLAGNEGKPARERLTLIRIFEELRSQGYEGSYDAPRRYAKGWRRAQVTMTPAAYVLPLPSWLIQFEVRSGPMRGPEHEAQPLHGRADHRHPEGTRGRGAGL